MNRQEAYNLTKEELGKHGLKDWGVRMSQDINAPFLGMCMYKDKVIILNAHHVDVHPYLEIVDTIKHEVAHALCPSHGHDAVWEAKAREIGCTNTLPCSHLSLPLHVIDAIRSGQLVEMEVEEKVITNVIRTPKYTVTRLQDKCPDCGKVAVEKFSFESIDKQGNTVKMITLECFHIIKKIIPRGTPFESMVSNDWKPEIKSCPHVWPKDRTEAAALGFQTNQCMKCREFKLMKFQITGALAAESGLSMQKGFGLFDDMGLGKTVQALALIKFHAAEYTPTLYVVKSAITFQWLKSILRWLGPEFLGQIIKSGKDTIMPGLKTYIISYDLLRRMKPERLKAVGFKLVVLDECQQIKNPDSTRTQEVRKLVGMPGVKVLPMSGTPWKNRGSEFFPVLNMMDPLKFGSYQRYLDEWVDYYYQGTNKKMGGIKNIKRFRTYTESLLIRREFNEVMEDFPEINRTKLNVQLDDLQQTTYDDSVSEFVKWYNDAVIGGEEESLSGIEILAKMTRMRHITGLAKIPATLGFVEEFVEETEKKLVIFVHHKDVGELMHNALLNRDEKQNPDYADLAKTLVSEGVKVLKYTSELSDSERFAMQEEFNRTPRAIMIASTLACGEGVDLQTCSDSIMHERQWNPQNEDQAAPGRFRRIGQESKVINVTFPEAEGTIDEHLDYLVSQKRSHFHNVMNKGEVPTWNQNEMGKELAALIVAKHNAKHKNKPAPNKSLTAQASYK